MEKELLQALQSLKKAPEKEKKRFVVEKELSFEENEDVRNRFFECGVQNWYKNFESLTFPSVFISLSKEAAREIVIFYEEFIQNKVFSYEKWQITDKINKFSSLWLLEEAIAKELNDKNWKKFFIKHSTRSPKDSPLLVSKAFENFKNINGISLKSFQDKLIDFTTEIRKGYCLKTATEAIVLLTTSEKIYDVCRFSLEEKQYNSQQNQIIIRQWQDSIDITGEYRGFVWNGALNAICPYYHWFYWEELLKKELEIKKNIEEFFEKEIKNTLKVSKLMNCQIDFAILPNNKVLLIEINPFDGKVLGSFPVSTGLFSIDNAKDLEIIQNGPLELRLRRQSLSNHELKFRIDELWRKTLKEFL